MHTNYQPIVIEKSKELIEILRETYFFEDYEIDNEEFAFNFLCEKLTEKFIKGELSEGDTDEPIFTEDEMDFYLRQIIVGSLLHDLQEKGIVDSIEDENQEERFFLTEKGKKITKNLKGDNDL
jgi:hypothetical protein